MKFSHCSQAGGHHHSGGIFWGPNNVNNDRLTDDCHIIDIIINGDSFRSYGGYSIG